MNRSAVWLLIALVGGCGGRSVAGTDGSVGSDGPRRDGPWVRYDRGLRDLPWWPPPDRFIVPDKAWPPPKLDHGTPCSGVIGARCNKPSDCCGAAPSCVALSTGIGICTKLCMPDDPSTPLVNEDSCPNLNSHLCGNTDASGMGKTVCMRRCAPALGKATCAAGVACRPESMTFSKQPNTAVCVYPPCKNNQDCPVRLSLSCNLANPGTVCTAAGIPAGAYCVPDEPGSPAGTCALSGICDPVSGLCKPHARGKATAQVAQTCTDDRDCAGNMFCDQQVVNSAGVAHARNGYCSVRGCGFPASLPEFACPAGATCQLLSPGGRCYKTCDLTKATDCRNNPADKHGDYDCYAWNNLSMGGVMIAKTPTCEPADIYPCNFFGGSKLDCSVLGTQGNPTSMTCRDRVTGKQLSILDPSGLCLDLTASGP